MNNRIFVMCDFKPFIYTKGELEYFIPGILYKVFLNIRAIFEEDVEDVICGDNVSEIGEQAAVRQYFDRMLSDVGSYLQQVSKPLDAYYSEGYIVTEAQILDENTLALIMLK